MQRNRLEASIEQLQRVWQNRQPRSGPVRLGAVVQALVQTEGLNKPNPLASLQGHWDEQVGPELSRHSRLEGLRRGTLRVEVDSAAHMVELKGMVQGGLTKQLSECFEDRAIRTIRLRLGSQRALGATGRAKAHQKERKRCCRENSYDQS